MKPQTFDEAQEGGFSFLDGFIFSHHLEKPGSRPLRIRHSDQAFRRFIIYFEIRADHIHQTHRMSAGRNVLGRMGQVGFRNRR